MHAGVCLYTGLVVAVVVGVVIGSVAGFTLLAAILCCKRSLALYLRLDTRSYPRRR